jgi:hypothetical protein
VAKLAARTVVKPPTIKYQQLSKMNKWLVLLVLLRYLSMPLALLAFFYFSLK